MLAVSLRHISLLCWVVPPLSLYHVDNLVCGYLGLDAPPVSAIAYHSISSCPVTIVACMSHLRQSARLLACIAGAVSCCIPALMHRLSQIREQLCADVCGICASIICLPASALTSTLLSSSVPSSLLCILPLPALLSLGLASPSLALLLF